MSTTAILLAGGKGSRMNYRDKAWAEHAGKPLIHHVLDRIAPQVDSILISRNNEHEDYARLSYQCVSDANDRHEGPLSGISACLPLVKTQQTLVVPCDTPDLPKNLVMKLNAGLSAATDLSVAHDQERLQQLIFLAKTEALASIDQYLAEGRRSVYGWLETKAYNTVSFDTTFHNINRETQLI